MSIEQQTIAGLKWTSLSKLVSQLFSWTVTLVVLRLLAPADYGVMAIIAVLIGLLTGIAEMGLGSSLVQARNLGKQEIANVTGITIVANAAIGGCLALAAPLCAWFYAEPRLKLLIPVATLQFVFNAVATVPQALSYREMQFKWLALVELIVVLVGGTATVVLAWRGAGVWALVLGSVLQSATRAILLSRGHWPRPAFNRAGTGNHLKFGSMVSGLTLISQIINQTDIMIAGRMLSQQAVGLYSVSLHLATLPMQKIMGTINDVAFPAVAKMQDDRARLRVRMVEATRLMMLVAIPVLWGMSATAPEFVRSVLGQRWLGAIFPLQAVCLVVPLQMINGIYSTAALGMRNVRVCAYNVAVSAVVLPAAFFAGVRWGVNGLAYAWLVAVPLVFALRTPGMIRCVSVTVWDLTGAIWSPFVAAGCMYLVVILVRGLSEALSDAWRLPLLVIAGALAYLASLRIFDRRAVADVRRFLLALRG